LRILIGRSIIDDVDDSSWGGCMPVPRNLSRQAAEQPVSARPAHPRVSPCRHCARPVLRDNDGRWIHADLSYVCRDPWGGLASTTAEPAAPRV
jgi:hypothetical protein